MDEIKKTIEIEKLLEQKHYNLTFQWLVAIFGTILISFFSYQIFFNSNRQAINNCTKINSAAAILNDSGYIIDCKIVK